MPIALFMPALSPTMTEGNVGKWLRNAPTPLRPGCEKQAPATVRFNLRKKLLFNSYPPINVVIH